MELSKRVSETEKGHGHAYPNTLFNEPAEIREVFQQKKEGNDLFPTCCKHADRTAAGRNDPHTSSPE